MISSDTAARPVWSRLVIVPAAIFAVTFGLTGCIPGDPGSGSTSPAPSATGTSSGSPTPSESESESPSPEPAPPAPPSLSASDVENIQESISSGNTAALEGYLTNPVHIAFARSGLVENTDPFTAIGYLDQLAGSSGWDWSVDAPSLAIWRASAFTGTWFPEGAIIGKAATGQVISFVVLGDHITDIYVALNASLLDDSM
jgi:hypothetical protein